MRINYNKYHSKKTTVNGIEFDSRKESRRYQDLLLLERAGAIQDLQRQVKFVLIPAQCETFERYGKTVKNSKMGNEHWRGNVLMLLTLFIKWMEKWW